MEISMAKITDFKIGDKIYRASEITDDFCIEEMSVKLDSSYKNLFSVDDVFAEDWERVPSKKFGYTLVYPTTDDSNIIDGIIFKTYDEAFRKKGNSAFVAKVEWEE
jgi:hypothetical protein